MVVQLSFNTSHVSINPGYRTIHFSKILRFNTSHVSINLTHVLGIRKICKVSIHLMFLLIRT